MTFQKIDWNVRTFQGLEFRLITTFIVKITWRKVETFRFEDEDDHEYEIFACSQNIDFPESFILPFFFRKVSIVIFSEGGYALSRSQNDKTSNIWYLVFVATTFAPKTRSRMTTATTFSRQNNAGSRVSNT